MPYLPGDDLIDALHTHNPWWEHGTEQFSLPARYKSDFYHLARPGEPGSQLEDQPVLGIVGRRGAGKTTLLHQFIQHRIDGGYAPEQFLYLPFDADPLYQLQSGDQLQRAVRYFESRIMGRIDTEDPHFILIDDIHTIEHPNKPNTNGWGGPVATLLREASGRHIVVTASAGVQVERELDRVGVDQDAYEIQPILPEKFRDYLYTLYPALEEEGTRVSPSPLRAGDQSLPTVLETGEIAPLVDALQEQYDRVADAQRRIQSQVVEYLAMGGIISYAQEGAVESATALTTEDYARLRREVRDALYQDIPGFESINTIADLERLCALAARNRGAEPIRYQELVELFGVDRRTITDSYLPALAELYLLTGVTEYDNSRPRSVRLYLRDTGLVTALTGDDVSTVRNEYSHEADLARIAAFDHTMRFAYNMQSIQGSGEVPTVQYWRGRNGVVDFVFTLNGHPVPVGLAYQPRDRDTVHSALTEFQSEYEAPVGLLLTGDVVSDTQPVASLENGVIELPYWLYLLLC